MTETRHHKFILNQFQEFATEAFKVAMTCNATDSYAPINEKMRRKTIFQGSWLVGWLVVFNVPSTPRSFRDGTPIYCPLRRTWSLINTPFRPGIEPRAVAWQYLQLPGLHAAKIGITQIVAEKFLSFRYLQLHDPHTHCNSLWCDVAL